MKNIKVGEYWTVKYSNYQGIVLVMGVYGDSSDDYSCFIAKDLPQKWINKFSGSRFCKRDFRKKTTEKAFLKQRASFLIEQANKCKTRMDKL